MPFHQPGADLDRSTGCGFLVGIIGHVAKHEAPPRVEALVRREVLVERTALDVVRPAERKGDAVDGVHVDRVRRGGVERAQVV